VDTLKTPSVVAMITCNVTLETNAVEQNMEYNKMRWKLMYLDGIPTY